MPPLAACDSASPPIGPVFALLQLTTTESVEGWAPGSVDASPRACGKDQEAVRRPSMANLEQQHKAMLLDGWTSREDGSYVRTDALAEKFTLPPVDGMFRRVTRDAKSRKVIEDLQLPLHLFVRNAGVRRDYDRRIARSTKTPVDIETEMHILAVDTEKEDPTEALLEPKDASIYRAIVANH